MPRILLITTSYPDRDDGESAAGVFVRDFARALRQAGAEVEVSAPALQASLEEEGGIRVSRFAVPKLPLSLLNPAHVADWSAIASTLVRGKQAVMNACERRRPDHILALWALPSGHWAMHASRRNNIPYSIWALGSDIWTLGRLPVVRQYLALVLRRAARRFADGYQLAADVERIGHRPCAFLPSSRRFAALPTRRPAAAPPYRLVFLGRWHPNKGVDLLMDALDLLNSHDWGRIEGVRIYGGGPLAARIDAYVARLRSAGHPVEIGGYLDLAGAQHLFDWADYVVIPSRIESIPVVFSDAMQAGRPVITTPVGDLPRLLNDLQCGILAHRADAQSIALAIRQALNASAQGFEAQVSTAAALFDTHSATSSFLGAIE